ncbi:hypothetical protein MMYC01_209826 [Madurella mycetomatis]|uniref:Heterokaryon incompatibility domain-containing protein n=1 Tax=Madurella mycetomatis TaxID=100816 RepID=A0A175VS85_9PEZI|nr:hypothetical protein MMYC01_209826 [Madurella mycetomatis]
MTDFFYNSPAEVKYTVIHRDPLSEPLRLQMLSWLKLCDKGHGCCEGNASLPSRLLDIRDLNCITLRESANMQRHGGSNLRYATLSHCWGSSRNFLATRETVFKLMRGFRFSEEAPKTFSDAVHVAHGLGIPYLWIDPLCIIQDDVSDWDAEASRMADVYSNSYLTIAAASSDDDRKGLLQPRSFQYATIKLNSPVGGSMLASFSWEGNRLFGGPIPLFQRGWVLQEQFLSPRNMIFSDEKVH